MQGIIKKIMDKKVFDKHNWNPESFETAEEINAFLKHSQIEETSSELLPFYSRHVLIIGRNISNSRIHILLNYF